MDEKEKKSSQVVTIYDVAAEADVSLATVSRVINNSAVVRPERRKRVEDAIKKLNFKPNEIARGLARKRSTSIGILVADINRAEVVELLAGVIDTANLKQYGYGVSINSYLGDEETFRHQIERMVSNQIDGLLVMCDYVSPEIHEILTNLSIPTVLFATPNTYSDLHAVSINYDKIGADIANYVIGQKYQEATIIARDTENETVGILGAFNNNCKNSDIRVEHIAIKNDYHYAKAYQELYTRYQNTTIPPFVFATSDSLALAFSNAVQDLGKKIPEDVEIISFSNTPMAVIGRPQLTSVMYPVYRIGAYAMSIVTKLIKEEKLENIPALENDFEIIWRESTKK